jgi:hypothetical protein
MSIGSEPAPASEKYILFSDLQSPLMYWQVLANSAPLAGSIA